MLFKVDGMSCGHCVKAVTDAVQEVDAGARVSVDLASGRVRVDSAAAAGRVAQAIAGAGYEAAVLPGA